ncbi:type II toxin-antitoxin system PemK/MazF family toxin [Zhenpiania hominis]|uniref:mRNA interferase n=1 Tax=Zhenpiania hominis TaxID=2763644 RepID=A0A923SPN3_9FIRM|nr:type II toxin-antitoxin system PemK/MazF family toxin [Zhenpiania hominis]MBC6678686.1 type II toxin-antitoxin system PemK/MazF family toxin [Zhenpiania hominis]
MEERSFKRGEIYVADLSPYVGSEQGGIRPVIILQNNLGNIFSPTLIVAPLTSKYKKRNLPTHYLIEDVEELKTTSLVLLEQIKTIDKRRITEYIGQASKDDIKNIEKALTISLGFEIPVEIDAP